jgi:ElaB/YqjD/DUF883 family membrane-anchored ribosome-binding protein
MATTRQLEKQVDKTRGSIEETLAELRERLSPPSLVEEALGYAKENGGADFVRNLGRQVADNPLPVALMGAGLAWLMVAQNRSANGAGSTGAGRLHGPAKRTEAMSNYDDTGRSNMRSGSDDSDTRGMTDKAKEMLSRASDTMGDMRDRASDVMGRARESTSGAYDKVSGAYGKVSGTVSRSMSSAVDTVSSAMPSSRGITNFLQEEPMVLAGVGVALGAIIGALLPRTELEERYIGPTAEQLKEQAKSVAREQWERGKEMAAGGWEEAKDAALRSWEDVKQEAQQGLENTQQRMDTGSGQAPLVPSGQESDRERLADATSRGDSRS